MAVPPQIASPQELTSEKPCDLSFVMRHHAAVLACPYWIFIIVGGLVLVSVLTVVAILKIRCLRKCVFPFRNRPYVELKRVNSDSFEHTSTPSNTGNFIDIRKPITAADFPSPPTTTTTVRRRSMTASDTTHIITTPNNNASVMEIVSLDDAL